jgi:hypothetical protein
MDAMILPVAMSAGDEADQVEPLSVYVMTFPEASPIWHCVVTGQDMESSAVVLSMLLEVQVIPFPTRTFPALSTARQIPIAGQETAFIACPESATEGASHELP